MDQRGEEIIAEHVAKGFQDSVVEVLTTKTVRAAKDFGVKQVIVAGGVSANRGLRESLRKALEQEGIPFTAPPLNLCNDNAAMIACAASEHLDRGHVSDLSIAAQSRLPLSEVMSLYRV